MYTLYEIYSKYGNYIGMTLHYDKRIYNHNWRCFNEPWQQTPLYEMMRKGIEFDARVLMCVDTLEEARAMEKFLIKELKPTLNVHHNKRNT